MFGENVVMCEGVIWCMYCKVIFVSFNEKNVVLVFYELIC